MRTVASNRQLRGFDLGRVRRAVSALTLPTLCDSLETLDGAHGGAKAEVIRRILRHVQVGDVSVSSLLAGASKDELRRACRCLEIDDRGTVADLIGRIDRTTRYSTLGDAASVPEVIRSRVDVRLSERERLLVLELHARLGGRARGATRFTLGELIGRLGRHRAEHRARGSAAREVGAIMWESGLGTEPDLRLVESSPGIDTVISVRLREGWPGSELDPGTEFVGAPSTGLGADLAASVAELGMAVSKSDKVVHESEIEAIRARAARDAQGLATADRARLLELVERLREKEIDATEAARRIGARLDIEQRSSVMQYLFDVAIADGIVVEEEEAVLLWLNDALTPHPGLFKRLMATYKATVPGPSDRSPQPPGAGGMPPVSHQAAGRPMGATPGARVARPIANRFEAPLPGADDIDEIIGLLFSS